MIKWLIIKERRINLSKILNYRPYDSDWSGVDTPWGILIDDGDGGMSFWYKTKKQRDVILSRIDNYIIDENVILNVNTIK